MSQYLYRDLANPIEGASAVAPSARSNRSPTPVPGRSEILALGPELRIATAAAQTRTVSQARIRLEHRRSARAFKGIICDDISEFESYMPSHAVRSLCGTFGRLSEGRFGVFIFSGPP